MRVAVCWKWVSLDREHEPDQRWAGVSAADEAALETALALSDDVTVVCLGPADADDTLRAAIAVGATSVVRIDASTELEGRTVATAIAEHIGDIDVVLCGDYSVDRGTGSVPAFLAAELGAAQALGLVDVDVHRNVHATATVLRSGSSVASTAAAARCSTCRCPPCCPWRGPWRAFAGHHSPPSSPPDQRRFRRSADPTDGCPSRRSIRTGPAREHCRRPQATRSPECAPSSTSAVPMSHAETVTLAPADAAHRILDQLREWGYLDESDA